MPYFLNYFSNRPRNTPSFKPINKDGSKYIYPDTKNIGLTKGYELNDTSSPRVNDLFKFAILRSAHRNIPNIFFCGGYVCLDEKARALFESIENGVHQFVPILLLRKNRVPLDSDYFILNIRTVLDSVVINESNLIPYCIVEGDQVYVIGENRPDYRTLDMSKTIGYDLWRERVSRRDIYFSDRLWAQSDQHNFLA